MADKAWTVDMTEAEVSTLYRVYAETEEEARKKAEAGDMCYMDGPYEMPLHKPRIHAIYEPPGPEDKRK